MGCFDTVIVPCPTCQHRNEVQSKGGDCVLATYELGRVPVKIADDLDGDAFHCEKCGQYVEMEASLPRHVEVKAFAAGEKVERKEPETNANESK